MTSTPGSVVVPVSAAASVCEWTGQPKPNSSDAELERRRVRLAQNFIVPNFPIKPPPNSSSTNLESACRRPATEPFRLARWIGHARRGDRSGTIHQSRSGNGRSARLERDAGRVQVHELGVGGEVQEFDRLRQQQNRRRCKQHGVCQRHDGADRAIVAGLLIGIGVGGGLLLLNRGNREPGLRRNPVEMSERKRELDRKRQQRQPRAMLDVRAEPLHADIRLAPEARSSWLPQRYNITSQGAADRVNRSRSAQAENSPGLCDSSNGSCDGRRAQRPSRSQVAANAPSSSSRPISPANNGSTPTPLTTLASRIFTPIQPSPRKMLDARTGTMRGSSTPELSAMRRASPPVACASGFSASVVDVTSENSFGLVGPTLISAFRVPSVACHSPSSLAGMVERQVPGSLSLRFSWRASPVGEVTVTGATLSAMVWRSTTRSWP